MYGTCMVYFQFDQGNFPALLGMSRNLVSLSSLAFIEDTVTFIWVPAGELVTYFMRNPKLAHILVRILRTLHNLQAE